MKSGEFITFENWICFQIGTPSCHFLCLTHHSSFIYATIKIWVLSLGEGLLRHFNLVLIVWCYDACICLQLFGSFGCYTREVWGNKQTKCCMTPLDCFTVGRCHMIDGWWHLQTLGPKPSRPQRHTELWLRHQLLWQELETTGAHRDISIWDEARQNGVKHCVTHRSNHMGPRAYFPISLFMSILPHLLHRGHPPTFTLWASHYQHPSMPGLSLYLPISPFFSRLWILPSSFHLHSLHDDTPAMLSWQQSGPDCLVAW